MRTTTRLTAGATLAMTVATGIGLAAATPATAALDEITVTLRVQVAQPASPVIDSFVTDLVRSDGTVYKETCDFLQPGVTTKVVTVRPGDHVQTLSTANCYAVVGRYQRHEVTAPATEIDVYLRADRFE